MDRLLKHPDLKPYFRDGQVPHQSTLNRWERAGRFPAPMRIGARWKAWRESDIERWLRDGGKAAA